MGQTNPSMEDILASIKRIIADDADTPAANDAGGHAEEAPMWANDVDENDVLELTRPLGPLPGFDGLSGRIGGDSAGSHASASESGNQTDMIHAKTDAAPDTAEIVSGAAADASRQALAALSALLVRPEPPRENTLEALVQDMLRPMLSEWLDAKLPAIVERLVAGEIARISGRQA